MTGPSMLDRHWRPGKLYDAIRKTPPPPCERCDLFQKCRDNSLACRAFQKYLDRSCDDVPYPYAMSIPKRRIYNKIFRACDNCKPQTCAECKQPGIDYLVNDGITNNAPYIQNKLMQEQQ